LWLLMLFLCFYLLNIVSPVLHGSSHSWSKNSGCFLSTILPFLPNSIFQNFILFLN
jgi:hypothetical protein